jgi:3-dehydroquinate synthase
MITKEYVVNNKKTLVKIGHNIFPEILEEIKKDFANATLFFIISKNIFQYIEIYFQPCDRIKYILIDDGEGSKSFHRLEELCERILSDDMDKNSVMISVGGGTISDLVGFAASIIFRGLRLIHIATTLLSQVDSAIGGKTAINSRYGKNLIGNFYLPERTYCDIKFLQSLPQRDYSSGYAEVLKYALILDAEFYDYLFLHQEDFITRNAEYLLYIIEKSVDYKAKIVASDFLDQSRRRILNFGHTIAHALEKASNYQIMHGEAVAIGMYIEAEFSMISGYNITEKDLEKLKTHLNNLGLWAEIFINIKSSKLMEFILKDKKNIDKQISLIMLESIGKAFVNYQVDHSMFKDFIEQKC